jgi:general stress protein 26
MDMVSTSASQEDRDKVWALIKDVKVALMVTVGDGGALHGRPMVALNKHFDGTLWFASGDTSPKLAEIRDDAHVLLAYSEPKDQNYISVAGTARIVKDAGKVKELWSEPLRTWFPKGPDDPSIALISVDVTSAEYWDAPSAAWVYAYGYVKAKLTGEPPKPGENKVVSF